MSKIKIILFIITLSFKIYSQAITVSPAFPTVNDNITITFHADLAQRTDLVNYNGTLYTHTGLITEESTDLTDWQYVIESWGNNQTQPSLTRIDVNTYELSVGQIRTFYGVNDLAEKILKLAFVFRSSDGSKQTENLYVDIYEPGLALTIQSPESFPVYPVVGEQINFKVICSRTANLSIVIDGNPLYQINGDLLDYTYSATESGKKTVIFSAVDGNETVSDSSYIFVRNQPNFEDLPAGLTTGINYIDQSTVTLALYAPGKDFVYLIGDFNDWQFDPATSTTWDFDEDYYMNQSSDGTIFWKTISGLTAGEEYAFQYLVDGNLRIADPYSDKVLDPWNDSNISASTYPGLKVYPTGKTSEIASTFKTNQISYEWNTETFVKPANEDLVIYELLLRDFLAEHDFKTLKDTLNYLKNLGINAIELMPINEFEGNNSWGYNPSFYFAVDKYYGPAEDLKSLIDECHSLGIAVIMDIVLNHSYGQSPFVRLYSSGNYGPPTAENPWYNVTSPNTSYSWGYDFNHESPQTQELVDRITKYWLTEFKFDGFRFDFTKGFTQTTGNGWAYDAPRINILKRMADQIWNVDPTAFVILEHLSDNSEETVLANYGMMLWGNMNSKYNEATMGYNENNKSDISNISYHNRGWTEPNLVGYMESHDEERLMYKNLTYGNSSGTYSTKSYNIALQRIKMAAAFFFPVPGPKMIWQFGELGYDYSIEYNGRLGDKPITWNYYQEYGRSNLFKTFAELISLKKNYPVFRTSDFTASLSSAVKTIYLNSETMNIAIAGNFDVNQQSVTINFQNTGKWYDFFSGDSIDVPYLQYVKNLQPGEFHIYSSVKLPTPQEDLLSDISENDDQIVPVHFSLYQNYPNPFNPVTNIRFDIPEAANITLTIYNSLGQKISTLVNEYKTAGSYKIDFDGSDFASGIYLYRIESDKFTLTKKMLLLK
ncbi:MAG: T9SS type A sorting domain-containing protein [Bacteroidetes bacterium]|nr:T9SS type A sorting domain-containing protein [Bacteroidota bacterium]